MSLERFSPDAAPERINAALMRDGATIVEALLDPETTARIVDELRPEFERVGTTTQNDFNGYSTLRVNSILVKAPSSVAAIAHPLVMAAADKVLLPSCINYRIGSTTGIEIFPGESQQMLHRDDAIYPLRVPGVEWQISALWALDDFTEENGATHLIPRERTTLYPNRPPPADASIQAEMPKGSLLLYLGSTWHGGGANRSNQPRMGMVNTYALGWLRQETNQYLDLPQDAVARLPEHVRRLVGYQMHGDILGYYSDSDHSERRNPAWVEGWKRSCLPEA